MIPTADLTKKLIGDKIVKFSYKRVYQFGLQKQNLPTFRLKEFGTSWKFSAIIDNGMLDVSLMLEVEPACSDPQTSYGALCVLLCPPRGGNIRHRSKIHSMEPRDEIKTSVDIFESLLTDTVDPYWWETESVNQPKECAVTVEFSAVLIHGYPEPQLKELLDSSDRIMEEIDWPSKANKVEPRAPSAKLEFDGAVKYGFDKTRMLAKVSNESPLRKWHEENPDGKVLRVAFNPSTPAVNLFLEYIHTGHVSLKSFAGNMMLQDVIKLADYFGVESMMDLCKYALVEQMWNYRLAAGVVDEIDKLGMPEFCEIIKLHRLAEVIIPILDTEPMPSANEE